MCIEYMFTLHIWSIIKFKFIDFSSLSITKLIILFAVIENATFYTDHKTNFDLMVWKLGEYIIYLKKARSRNCTIEKQNTPSRKVKNPNINMIWDYKTTPKTIKRQYYWLQRLITKIILTLTMVLCDNESKDRKQQKNNTDSNKQ